MTIQLGLQIPNFDYGNGVAETFPMVLAQAEEAEAAGYDSVFMMDHLYQLPVVGTPELPVLEAYTVLGALAHATKNVQLGTLVTSNTFRNPTLLAKIITTLDVLSAGRAILGMGTGYFELEHTSLGIPFGTFTERFDKLREAIEIIGPMLAGERSTHHGTHYCTSAAFVEPRYRDHIPLMIGGSGEKKTIPMAAKYFDHVNMPVPFAELGHKVDVVRKACEEIGRDPASLETSTMVPVLFGEEISIDSFPPAFAAMAAHGSAEQIVEQIKTRVLDAGIGGVILSPLTSVQGYLPGKITEVATLLKPLLNGDIPTSGKPVVRQ